MIIFYVLKSSDALLCIFQLPEYTFLDLGVLSDRNLASRSQNRPKWAQKDKPSFYSWIAVSGWPTGPTHRYFLHLDSIRIIQDGESGCDKCVTSCLSHNCHTIVTSVFVHPAVRKLRKLSCETEVNTMLTQRADWIRFWLLWDRIPLQNVWQAACHTIVTLCHIDLVHSEVGNIKNNIVPVK